MWVLVLIELTTEQVPALFEDFRNALVGFENVLSYQFIQTTFSCKFAIGIHWGQQTEVVLLTSHIVICAMTRSDVNGTCSGLRRHKIRQNDLRRARQKWMRCLHSLQLTSLEFRMRFTQYKARLGCKIIDQILGHNELLLAPILMHKSSTYVLELLVNRDTEVSGKSPWSRGPYHHRGTNKITAGIVQCKANIHRHALFI